MKSPKWENTFKMNTDLQKHEKKLEKTPPSLSVRPYCKLHIPLARCWSILQLFLEFKVCAVDTLYLLNRSLIDNWLVTEKKLQKSTTAGQQIFVHVGPHNSILIHTFSSSTTSSVGPLDTKRCELRLFWPMSEASSSSSSELLSPCSCRSPNRAESAHGVSFSRHLLFDRVAAMFKK